MTPDICGNFLVKMSAICRVINVHCSLRGKEGEDIVNAYLTKLVANKKEILKVLISNTHLLPIS